MPKPTMLMLALMLMLVLVLAIQFHSMMLRTALHLAGRCRCHSWKTQSASLHRC